MDDYLEIIRHDAFRYGGGLNKSAAEVYWQLKQAPMTSGVLIQKTGRSRTTVFRSLQRMAKVTDGRTGEIISMVENRNGVWHLVLDVNLDRIALFIGMAGIGKHKREQYRMEQVEHQKSLLLGQKGRQQ